MTSDGYSLLLNAMLWAGLAMFLAALGLLTGAFIGWRTPFRRRALMGFAVLLATSIATMAAQQVLLWKVWLPAREREMLEQSRSQSSGTLTKVGAAAPRFSVVTNAGDSFDLERVKGKVVVLNFFATWCGPCMKELPHLDELWDEYGRRDDFTLLVVGREETDETIAKFQAHRGFSFPLAADPDRAVYGLYASESIPRTYLIARDGTIAYQSVGFQEQDFARLKQALAE